MISIGLRSGETLTLSMSAKLLLKHGCTKSYLDFFSFGAFIEKKTFNEVST